MNSVLVASLAVSLLWGTANKFALKSFGLYYRKKGYPQPTDEELKACSREVLQKLFK